MARFWNRLATTLGGMILLNLLWAPLSLNAQDRAADLYQRALEAERRQDWDSAVQAYLELAKLAPDLAELQNNLGIALHYQGDYPESTKWLQKALQKKPEMIGARLFLGLDLYLLGRFPEAIAELTAVTERDPGNAAALLHLGAAQLASGDGESAIATLQSARRVDPGNVEVLHTLAKAYMARSKQLFNEGRELYQRILESDPDSPRTHQILAEAFLSQEQPEKAIESYRRAIELRPNDANLHAALGEVLFQLGKNADARVELEEAIQLRPQLAKANLELAILDNSERRFSEAVAHLNAAAAQLSGAPDLHIERAKALAGLEKPDAAIESLKKALQLDPESAAAHYQLAQLYRSTGAAELARQHLAEFSRLEKLAEERRQADAQSFLKGKTP